MAGCHRIHAKAVAPGPHQHSGMSLGQTISGADGAVVVASLSATLRAARWRERAVRCSLFQKALKGSPVVLRPGWNGPWRALGGGFWQCGRAAGWRYFGGGAGFEGGFGRA